MINSILFIESHTDLTLPPVGGRDQRTQLLLKACQLIADVDVVSFVKTKGGNDEKIRFIYNNDIPPLLQAKNRFEKMKRLLFMWRRDYLFSVNRIKQEIINECLKQKKYDYVIIRYVTNALEVGIDKLECNYVIDVDDDPYKTFISTMRASKSLRAKLYHWFEAVFAQRITRFILERAAHSFVSDPLLTYDGRSIYLPNIPYYTTPCTLPDNTSKIKRLLFVGDMEYFPNYYGVNHFIYNIFPLIKEKMPNVEFHVVGRINNEKRKERWSNITGVYIDGFSKDLYLDYQESHVVVIPIYHGSGTNIKVLEGMQMERPMVVSQYATRGYDFHSGKSYLVAETDKEFAYKVVELLQNVELYKQIVLQAKVDLKDKFSLSKFENVVKSTLTNQFNTINPQ